MLQKTAAMPSIKIEKASRGDVSLDGESSKIFSTRCGGSAASSKGGTPLGEFNDVGKEEGSCDEGGKARGRGRCPQKGKEEKDKKKAPNDQKKNVIGIRKKSGQDQTERGTAERESKRKKGLTEKFGGKK